MTTDRNARRFVLFAMVLAMPAAALAQVQQPAPVSSKLPPGLTFSVAVGQSSGGDTFGDTSRHTRTPTVSGSVEIALNRFMLAQGELFTWREQSSGSWRGFATNGALGPGYSGDFAYESRDRNTAVGGNFLGRFGAGRFHGNAGFGVGVMSQARTSSNHVTGCVPHFVGACNIPPYNYSGSSLTFMMQFLAGVDVRLTPRLTAFANIRTVGSEATMTATMGGVRWTVRREPVGPGWKGDANPAAAADAVGKAVHVEALDHSRRNGTLVSLTATHVTVRNMAGAVTVPLTEVRGIRRQTHAILGGTLVGLGGGFGTGLALCAASGGCGDEGAWVALMMMGIGAGAGGGIGAIYNLTTADTRTIYVNPRKSALSVMPIVGKQRAGIGGRIAW